MLVLALTDPRAQLDEVFVGVDDRSLDGLCGPRVVSAVVEGDPTSPVLVTLPNLRPTHPTAHELFSNLSLEPAKPGFEPNPGCPLRDVLHRYNAGPGSVKATTVVFEQQLIRCPAFRSQLREIEVAWNSFVQDARRAIDCPFAAERISTPS